MIKNAKKMLIICIFIFCTFALSLVSLATSPISKTTAVEEYTIIFKPIISITDEPDSISFEVYNKTNGKMTYFTAYKNNNYNAFAAVDSVGEYEICAVVNNPLKEKGYELKNNTFVIDGRPSVEVSPTILNENSKPNIQSTTNNLTNDNTNITSQSYADSESSTAAKNNAEEHKSISFIRIVMIGIAIVSLFITVGMIMFFIKTK